MNEPESIRDYNQIQVKAAKIVLLEMTEILSDIPDGFLVCGGWVPDLLIPEHGHVGSIDVDLLLNSEAFKDFESGALKRRMESAGFRKMPDHFFAYQKTVDIEGTQIEVEVDFLSGKYGKIRKAGVSQHIAGIKALRADGGAYAFTFPATQIQVEDGGAEGPSRSSKIPLVSVVPFFAMKTSAMTGRDKPKDAYDIYFLLANWNGGLESLSQEFIPYRNHPALQNGFQLLGDFFSGTAAKGPDNIIRFLEVEDPEEIDRIRQDAVQRVQELIRLVMR